MTIRILIIKLGALGDVVRTLSVLPALKEKFPDSEIYWLTKKESLDIFEGNHDIKQVFSLPHNFDKEEFDILYNFDTEDEATLYANQIKAKKKLGFSSQEGFPSSFNLGAEYYLNTIFDDELKKTNKKTVQEMMFDAAELNYKKQDYKIYLNKKDNSYAEKFLNENKINPDKLIGIHMGSSSRWPSKVWDKENLIDFIIKTKKRGYEILVFGGPNEIAKLEELKKQLEKKKIEIFINNPKNTNKEFSSLVNLCKKMICADSFALHISLALKKQTIGLFFCTSPDEIEGYGLLKKIISPRLYEFFPTKMNEYNKDLTKSISADQVLKELESL